VRYLNLSEALTIQDASILLTDAVAFFNGVPLFKGDFISTRDLFQTHNHFFGGQIGIRGEYRLDRVVLQGSFKLALGDTHQTETVNGVSTLLAADGSKMVLPGGLLALPSNSGSFSRDQFALVPEADLRVGYAITPYVTCSLGYDFLWWSSVARPGSQIPHVLSDTQIPSSPAFNTPGHFQPVPQQHPTGFYLHGLMLSLECKF
jgi:hypothetical protein